MPTHPERLKTHARQYVRPWDEHLVDRAIAVAFRGHQGQKRETGEAFVEHPMAVARIVSSLQCDLNTFVAALLHDVVEDTQISLEQVADEFGRDVALIVNSLTKLSEFERRERQLSAESQRHETLRKILVGAANDLRVAYIKLADRLHNLSTTDPNSSDRVNRAIQETATYFSPLARELGIGQLHRKLELWSLSLARPTFFRVLETVVRHGEKDLDQRFRRIKDTLDSRLREAGIPRDRIDAPVEDTILFINRLIATDAPSASEIHDLLAHNYQLSWVFDSSVDCYAALASIHTLWTPVYTHFQDWITSPLPSGYAAIHTLVDIGSNELVTFRLQTREMRQRAEWGPLFLLRDAYDYDAAYHLLPQIALLSTIRELDRVAKSTEQFLEFIPV
jgi:guanosine-3',5'-bis(diphosphate) 3'-pyrophosphohydrolase